jgi:hypothetical protein
MSDISLKPTYDSGRNVPTSGAINVDLTQCAGDGITIYTNAGYRQNGQAMLRIVCDNPAYNDPLIWIKRNSGNSNPEIRIDSQNPNIELVETRLDNNVGGGKFEIAVKNDQIQINGRAADNTTFETIVMFDRNTKAGTQNAGQGGMWIRNGGFTIWLNKASSHGVGFKAPETLQGTAVYTLPDPSTERPGYVLTADGSHNLKWAPK